MAPLAQQHVVEAIVSFDVFSKETFDGGLAEEDVDAFSANDLVHVSATGDLVSARAGVDAVFGTAATFKIRNPRGGRPQGFRLYDDVVSVIGLVAIASTAVAAVSATATTTVATATTAASTTTVATAAPTTTTAEATATATTASTTAFFAGSGFVDGEGASAVLLTIERADGGLGFFVSAHFDETEAFGASGVAVVNDLSRDDGPVLTKQLFQFRAVYLIAQVPNIKLLTH